MTTAPIPAPVDPLFDFDGRWTTELADEYLPDPRFPEAFYECVDGRLIMSPAEASPNGYGVIELAAQLRVASRAAGYYVLGPINLTFSENNWINPDLTVLHTAPGTDKAQKWVPADHALMPIEFVSPGRRNRHRDMIDKPARCAAAGIPYFMRVQIVSRLRSVEIELLKLDAGMYQPLASAAGDQLFQSDEPFPIRVTPLDLLLP